MSDYVLQWAGHSFLLLTKVLKYVDRSFPRHYIIMSQSWALNDSLIKKNSISSTVFKWKFIMSEGHKDSNSKESFQFVISPILSFKLANL